MKQICQKIAFWCQQNSDMPEEEYPILVYGVEVLANTSVKILGLLILGYICNCIVEAVITIAVFGSMRYWSGGYHCKTHIGCFIAMLGMCIGSTVLSKIMIQKSALIWLLMVTYSCWAVIRYAPQVSHINPITSSNILRKKESEV